jgi:hypothetical protein
MNTTTIISTRYNRIITGWCGGIIRCLLCHDDLSRFIPVHNSCSFRNHFRSQIAIIIIDDIASPHFKRCPQQQREYYCKWYGHCKIDTYAKYKFLTTDCLQGTTYCESDHTDNCETNRDTLQWDIISKMKQHVTITINCGYKRYAFSLRIPSSVSSAGRVIKTNAHRSASGMMFCLLYTIKSATLVIIVSIDKIIKNIATRVLRYWKIGCWFAI